MDIFSQIGIAPAFLPVGPRVHPGFCGGGHRSYSLGFLCRLVPGANRLPAERRISHNLRACPRGVPLHDGVFDHADNCTLDANGPLIPDTGNNVQLDTDGDGFGNLCDGDLNNDQIVNVLDLGLFKARFFTTDEDADLNGDGIVNALDLGVFKDLFFQPPGPSGPLP